MHQKKKNIGVHVDYTLLCKTSRVRSPLLRNTSPNIFTLLIRIVFLSSSTSSCADTGC